MSFAEKCKLNGNTDFKTENNITPTALKRLLSAII